MAVMTTAVDLLVPLITNSVISMKICSVRVHRRNGMMY